MLTTSVAPASTLALDWRRRLIHLERDQIASGLVPAAGDRNVYVVGGYVVRRALGAGVLDEMQIHPIPVLPGRGRRRFDVLPTEIELKIVHVIDTPEATHIRYRVRR